MEGFCKASYISVYNAFCVYICTYVSSLRMFDLFQWLLRLVLLVLVINAAGMNIFGVLAVDFSTVTFVKEDSPSLQELPSLAINANNTTLSFSLTMSSASSSPSPVTTAKTVDSLAQRRSDFCLLFSEYKALCQGCYSFHG